MNKNLKISSYLKKWLMWKITIKCDWVFFGEINIKEPFKEKTKMSSLFLWILKSEIMKSDNPLLKNEKFIDRTLWLAVEDEATLKKVLWKDFTFELEEAKK